MLKGSFEPAGITFGPRLMREVQHPSRFILLPLIFGAGALSWMILLASLAIIALVILAPAFNDVYVAQLHRNDMQAMLDQYNQKIAVQDRFIQMAASDPRLMQRLADRQMDVVNPSEQVLPLNGVPSQRDVQSLIDESLIPVTPTPVPPLPWWMMPALLTPIRGVLILIALAGLLVSFLVEIRRHPTP
ncbi:MAG TPA: hypothetical protein VMG59_03865 [Phycisphaerae bacterium]|nr:hypothetical protein [Phycisphaerae bacterium]